MRSRRPPCPAFASALIAAAVVAAALLPLGGCAALNKLFHPAAVSPGESAVIVNAERSVQQAFIICDEFVGLDDANRETFASQLPAVHAAAQEIRRKGQTFFPMAWDAVQLLKTSPGSAQQGDEVQRQLAQVQSLATMSQQFIAQASGSGVTVKPAPPRDSAARFRQLVKPASPPPA